MRLVDEVQYQRRRTRFDFDMMIGSWIASPSPGNEQRGRWSSPAATMEGSYNICGAASPAIDAMIGAVVAARGHDDFVAAVRALDRLLLSGFYIVPLFYAPDQWIAYSSALGRPEKTPMFGVEYRNRGGAPRRDLSAAAVSGARARAAVSCRRGRRPRPARSASFCECRDARTSAANGRAYKAPGLLPLLPAGLRPARSGAHSGATEDGMSEGEQALTIDVVSDVVCPWCYLGKRRLA